VLLDDSFLATYWIVDTVRRRVADRKLVDQNPLLERLDVVNVRHARASLVEIIGNIVHDRAPVDQVARCLVSKLLAMQRVALVRVVGDELAFILPGRFVSASASSIQDVV
jgi:hypothetical protein